MKSAQEYDINGMGTAVRTSKFICRSMSQSFSRETILDKCRGQLVEVEFRAGGRLLGNDIPITRKDKGNRSHNTCFLRHPGIKNKKENSFVSLSKTKIIASETHDSN